jgi:hypothetical protein
MRRSPLHHLLVSDGRQELRIRTLLTSTADINNTGRGRTSATPPGSPTKRLPQLRHVRIELLKRVSEFRILPGAPVQKGATSEISEVAPF